MDFSKLRKITDYEWEIPKTGQMRVPGKIFGDKKLIKEMDEKVFEQVSNVATLPGIVKYSLAMPDAHWGYGFCIGGVAAFDPEDGGVLSVGGVGFDVNCGVRTLKSELTKEKVQPKIKELIEELFNTVPAGLGVGGEITLSDKEVKEVLANGAQWIVQKGYGLPEDLEFTEEKGRVEGAIPEAVSELALRREKKQVGTLGSGNHYLEVQWVDEVYDEETAKAFGLFKNQVVITLHCGSRALGHQIGTDYLKVLAQASRKYNIPILEHELVCAPINSPEGKQYLGATNCAINYAFANRQVIAHLTRQAFKKIFPKTNLIQLYDIGHNTVKIEKHIYPHLSSPSERGRIKEGVLYVHRKGATRAFGPGREELPKIYQNVGQPIIIGGTMGTASYILCGTKEGEEKAFASVCHGAGRTMSRTKAKKIWRGSDLIKELEKQGIIVKGHSFAGLAEEAPGAYKDVIEVVNVICSANLAKKVVKLKPMGVVKG
jgi:tRNA-splicing ligase RtcB